MQLLPEDRRTDRHDEAEMCRLKPETLNCQAAATDVPFETRNCELSNSNHRCAVWNQKLWTVKQQPQKLTAPFFSRLPTVALRSVNYVVKQDDTHTHNIIFTCQLSSVTLYKKPPTLPHYSMLLSAEHKAPVFCHSVQEIPNTSPLLNVTVCWTQSTCPLSLCTRNPQHFPITQCYWLLNTKHLSSVTPYKKPSTLPHYSMLLAAEHKATVQR